MAFPLFQVCTILGVQAIALTIQNHKYWETKTLRVPQRSQDFLIFILGTVIQMVGDEIFLQGRFEGIIGCHFVVKKNTPAAPVATNLQQYVFALFGCLLHRCCDVGFGIRSGIVQFGFGRFRILGIGQRSDAQKEQKDQVFHVLFG